MSDNPTFSRGLDTEAQGSVGGRSLFRVNDAAGLLDGRACVKSSSLLISGTPDYLLHRVERPSGENVDGFLGITANNAADTTDVNVIVKGEVDAHFLGSKLPVARGEYVYIADATGLLGGISHLGGDVDANIVGIFDDTGFDFDNYDPSIYIGTDAVSLPIIILPTKHRPLVEEVLTDVTATAKVGGTTVFKTVGATPRTLTVSDGTVNGQRKLIIGDQGGGGGNMTVSVTNHALGTPYTVGLRGNASTLELVWSENLGLWTNHIPTGNQALPSGAVARFITTLSGGSKIQPTDPTISETLNALNLGALDLHLDSGSIVADGGTVIVNDELQVNEEAQINGAPKTFVLSGATLTPALAARALDMFGTVMVGEFSDDNPIFLPFICLRRTRGTPAAQTIVAAGDLIGSLQGAAYDGSDDQSIAAIVFSVPLGTTPSNGDVAGMLQLRTRPEGGGAPLNAITIDEDQRTKIEGILETTSSRVRPPVSTGINLTLDQDLHDVVIITAVVTVTLPASPEDGQEFTVKRRYAGASGTLDGNGNDIDGESTVEIRDQDALVVVYSSTEGEWVRTRGFRLASNALALVVELSASATLTTQNQFVLTTNTTEIDVSLPATPNENQVVKIRNFGSQKVFIDPNGETIDDNAGDYELDEDRAVEMVFTTSLSWVLTMKSDNVS